MANKRIGCLGEETFGSATEISVNEGQLIANADSYSELALQPTLIWVKETIFRKWYMAAQVTLVEEASMTTNPYAHQFSNWMKARLDEMDAVLTSIEKNAAALQADAKKHGEQAIAQMRAQREAFQLAIHKQQHENEAAWTKAKDALEANWASFEAAAQDYVNQARLSAQQQAGTFKARAEAQRKAWDETLGAL